ncbi:RRM_1 domain-containing protein [Cephalotus follicularis]|uniref:RRM_1 domain-containing protein n=1 Tax=Cephalotus follicularis TaxID=3775 RepID=A0A1Q3D1I4_CEPFO|nr:RRM_1 domain-containing protein [Cephalotus follicularis]
MMQSTAAATTNGGDLKNPSPQQQQQWVPHQHQQWMAAMQYPAAAMVMMQQQQQQMMYPQHYMAAAAATAAYNNHQYPYNQYSLQQQQQQYQKQQQQQQYSLQQQQQQGSVEDAKTIWVGDLLHWMDETYLHSCFSQTGEVSSAKVIRNKQTGQSERYGFVEFYTHAMAEKVLQSYNGLVMPNSDQVFRLNWASFSATERRSDPGSDLSIFVGDLAPDVTDTLLQETFASRYPSVKGAKVVFDSNTGRSKGYGFVRFGDENERSKAMTEMNGAYCSSRAMRIGVATPKKASGYQQQYSSQVLVLAGGGGHASNGAINQGPQSDGESDNATIFVGGLDSDATDEDLRQPFSQFGEVISVKIPVGKGCGFVQYANRKNAEDALEGLNGAVIGNQTVRLSWGRTPANKQSRNHSNQWNGAYYGRQGYGGYNQDYSAAAVPGAS